MKPWMTLCRSAGLALALYAQSVCADGLPPDSIYHLQLNLQDQGGRSFTLAAQRGRPRVVSMFYTSCEFVCPMLMETIERNEQALTAAERARISNLLVSFDPAHDDVAALAAEARKHSLDLGRWTLARADAHGVRKLAAMLGIQYRQLPSGAFNHSTELIVLDADGRILGRSNKMGALDPAFVALLRAAARAPAAPPGR